MSILQFEYRGLRKIISGGQTGVDQAGLCAAKEFDLQTGGFMPHGFRTCQGNRHEFEQQYNMLATVSAEYPPRTKLNVMHSDATIRLATNFSSPGEVLTLNIVNRLRKPHASFKLIPTPSEEERDQFIEFLMMHQVQVLNVAGNSDKSGSTLHFNLSLSFLRSVLKEMDARNLLCRTFPNYL